MKKDGAQVLAPERSRGLGRQPQVKRTRERAEARQWPMKRLLQGRGRWSATALPSQAAQELREQLIPIVRTIGRLCAIEPAMRFLQSDHGARVEKNLRSLPQSAELQSSKRIRTTKMKRPPSVSRAERL